MDVGRRVRGRDVAGPRLAAGAAGGRYPAVTTLAARTNSAATVTPNPGPVGQRTEPFSHRSGDVSLVTGNVGLPLNSMNGPMLGVNDAKWTTSRNPSPPPDMCGNTGSPAAAGMRATCVARMNPPP